jgi:chondroitin AC lyase
MDTLRKRLMKDAAIPVQDAKVNTMIADVNASGAVSDCPYADARQLQNGAKLRECHLMRLHTLASAWASKSSQHSGSPMLKDTMYRMIRFWVEGDFSNDNWWWRQIGWLAYWWRPLALLSEVLPKEDPALWKKALALLCVDGWQNTGLKKEGANGVDGAKSGVTCGVLGADVSVLHDVIRRYGQLFSVNKKDFGPQVPATIDSVSGDYGEGLHPDFSFAQHGRQAYWAAYGSVFIDQFTWALRFFVGTSFKFSQAELENFAATINQGLGMLYYQGPVAGDWEPSEYGRQISELERPFDFAIGLIDALLVQDASYPDATRNTLENVRRHKGRSVGHTHFWRLDKTVMRRPSWYASAVLSSKRTRKNEEPYDNFGHWYVDTDYMGSGAFFLKQRGDEYLLQTRRVLDYRFLPGTTVRLTSFLSQHRHFPLLPGSDTIIAGGVSDGMTGASGFTYDYRGVLATKSYMFFDDIVVLVGAGVRSAPYAAPLTKQEYAAEAASSDAPKSPIVTTLMQAPKRGAVDLHLNDKVSWLSHSDTGYVFLQKPTIGDHVYAHVGTRQVSREAWV